jgi:thiamine biosynthesis lipoprotein
LLLALALLASACAPGPRVETFAGSTMGTTYHVTVVGQGKPGQGRAELQESIDAVLREVNAHLSTYQPASEISVFNLSTSLDWQPVSPTLYAVLAAADRISRETDGAFDITVAPAVDLWGFGADGGAIANGTAPVPADNMIEAARASVGFRLIELRGPPEPAVRKLASAVHLDVNGIAPGYAVDRIAGNFEQVGIVDYLVEIGGEVRTCGHRPDGEPWRVAIESPVAGERTVYAGLQLVDRAVSTSGDYRDFRFSPDGRRISHTIDPRNGRPIAHGLASVTVVHARTIDADAYATALMVLGPEEGYALALRLQLPALFIIRTKVADQWQERATPPFEALRRPVP